MDAYTIVTRPDCIWCDRAKALLTSLGHSFREVPADTPEGAELLAAKSLKTVPQIWRDRHYVGGYTDLIEAV